MRNDFLEKIATGAGIFFIGIFISKILGYLYRLIVARIGPEEYGLLALGFAIVGITVTLSVIGLDSGTLRYVSFYKGKKDEARIKGILSTSLKIGLFLSFVFGFLMFIFSNWIAVNLFHNIKLSFILKAFAFTVPFYSVSRILLSALRAFQKIKYVVYAQNIMENIVKVVLTVILVYLGYGLFGAVIAYLISVMVMSFLVVYFLQKIFPIFKAKLKSIFLTKELISYSWPLMITGLLGLIVGWTDTIMIGYFRSAYEVGIYNAALPTAALMLIVPTALLCLFTPIATELLAKKKELELKQTYKTTMKWIFYINFPVFLLLIFFSRQILGLMFGSVYATGASALSILVFGYLFNSVFLTAQNILEVIKRSKLILFNTLIAAISNVLLNLYLIPRYGIVGGAIGTGFSLILFGFLCWFESCILKKMQPITKHYIKPIIAGAVAIFLVYKLMQILFVKVPLYGLILMAILFFVIYLMLLVLFKGFSIEDRKILRDIEGKIGMRFRFLRKIFRFRF